MVGSEIDLTLLDDAVTAQFGFVPNLLAAMKTSPETLMAYLELSTIFGKTTFSPAEQQLVLLSISVANECRYCAAAHHAHALQVGLSEDVVMNIRRNRALDEPRLEVLRQLTEEMVMERGRPRMETRERFFSAGWTSQNLVEIILAISVKTLTNYVDANLDIELDAKLAAYDLKALDEKRRV